MLHYRILVLFLGGLLAIASGCSGRKPFKAVVTLDGKAVEGATVALTQASGGSPISGMTGTDGTVTLDTAGKDGVPPGDYKVVVTKVKAQGSGIIDPKDAIKMMKGTSDPKSELPAIYASPTTTPLTLKVPSDTNPAKIELKSAP